MTSLMFVVMLTLMSIGTGATGAEAVPTNAGTAARRPAKRARVRSFVPMRVDQPNQSTNAGRSQHRLAPHSPLLQTSPDTRVPGLRPLGWASSHQGPARFRGNRENNFTRSDPWTGPCHRRTEGA